jgi:cytidine deaminase
VDELRRRLVEHALRARDAAYAPYSRYRVGAALACGDGRTIIDGANVENASYGLTVCAERVAIFRWVMAGRPGALEAIAVAAGPEGSAPTGGRPCGACLQVLREFAADLRVYLVDGDLVAETRLSQLLPDPFLPR